MHRLIRPVAILIAACLLSTLLAACEGEPSATPTATVSPTGTATVTAAPVTSTPEPTVDPTSSPSSTATPGDLPARAITGLSTDPRPATDPDEVHALPAAPASPFSPWNREDVVVYDTLALTELNLGPGAIGLGAAFSPDGTRFAWTAGAGGFFDEIWILGLASGDTRLVAEGETARWLDDHTLYARPTGTDVSQRLDVDTGEWSPAPDVDSNAFGIEPSETARWRLETPNLEVLGPDAYPYWSRPFTLTDLTAALPPLVFDAYDAVVASDGALFVATTPEDQSGPPTSPGAHIEYGTTNIFQVDPETGVATYLGSAEASAPGWAFDASEDHVAWMHGFCAKPDPSDRRTAILDRTTGRITHLDRGLWFELTPDSRLAAGPFGPMAFIDLATLDYGAVLPDGVGDVAHSADYRYAAIGYPYGHGGVCG
jgi:hypothetical protein